jgi:acyl-CoA synthetase (AMP-forming)/AMP-acid ligase II
VPTPGLELKLLPVDGKVEVRYRGPNITPGYWRAPEETAEAISTRKASSAPGTPCSGSIRQTSTAA